MNVQVRGIAPILPHVVIPWGLLLLAAFLTVVVSLHAVFLAVGRM